MSSLRHENQKTHTFEKKIDMLKEVFFFSSSSADLSDLQRYIYSAHMNCLMKIVKKEIVATLNRSKLDKTSKSNDITNRILKTCIESLTKLLTSLFQICVSLRYHSRPFRETHIITLKKMRKVDYTTLLLLVHTSI